MRSSFLLFVVLVFASCGSDSSESINVTDSVENADSLAKYNTTVYTMMMANATEIKLPDTISVSGLESLPGLMLNAASGYDLLPGEFEPHEYKSVYCIAKSTIDDNLSALWFRLTSQSDFEDAEDFSDIIMVLYGENGIPIDVCKVANENIGFGYSYVRTDSIFTLEFDEMENINITSTGIAITKEGFIAGDSHTETFQPSDAGSKESRAYADAYLSGHIKP